MSELNVRHKARNHDVVDLSAAHHLIGNADVTTESATSHRQSEVVHVLAPRPNRRAREIAEMCLRSRTHHIAQLASQVLLEPRSGRGQTPTQKQTGLETLQCRNM
jgi:hypothetical protein